MNKTSIIVVTYNNLSYTKKCLQSINRYTEANTYEIIVVDNNSEDGTYNWLKKQKNIRLILNNQNYGYPYACNQGIKIANKNNDILLLNNDIIVTKNWLINLKRCLYSRKKIGAVGSVSNHQENQQGVTFTYDNFSTMQKIATKNNISNPLMWEEKVFLIGYCLLIKRECLNKIGLLDVNYSPGYVDDNDYSIKIALSGYKQYLCHDSFIHHYLGTEFRKDLDSFYKLLNKNREYFWQKWHFKTDNFDILDTYSYPFLSKDKNVLIIGCNIGVSALRIKYLFQANVYGVEEDKAKRKIAKHFLKVYSRLDKVNKKFDYILIGRKLEDVLYPLKYLEELKKYLSYNGKIIGEIENINSINNIDNLLNNNWYFNHFKKNYFTINDLEKLASLANYKDIKIYSWYKTLNDYEKSVIDKLKVIYNTNYEYVSYSFLLRRN